MTLLSICASATPVANLTFDPAPELPAPLTIVTFSFTVLYGSGEVIVEIIVPVFLMRSLSVIVPVVDVWNSISPVLFAV